MKRLLILFMIAALCTTGSVMADIETGLIAHYDFEGVTGTTIPDVSGNGHDGVSKTNQTTPVAAPIVAGAIGDAIDCDNGNYVEIPNHVDFNVTTEYTLSCWVSVDTMPAQWSAIFCHGDSSWRMSRFSSTEKAAFQASPRNGTWGVEGAADIQNPKRWVHLVGTYENQVMTLYVDTQFDATVTRSAASIGQNTVDPVTIGAQIEAGELRRMWDGQIDDVRIYNRALTTDDIAELYEYSGTNLGAHTPDPTGTVISLDVPDYTASGVSWLSPLVDSDGNAVPDTNIVSVDSYDVWWSVNEEPNFLTDTPTNQTATSYLPSPAIDYATTYYWRVDTTVTLDTNEITGDFTSLIEGSLWSFDTEAAYTPVQIDTFDSVISTTALGADLVATVTGNSTPVATVDFEILTDDAEYPAGSDASLSDDGPTALTTTLSTSVAGTYKVKVTVTDTPSTPPAAVASAIAEVVIHADACDAKKAAPSGWTANYFDIDDDCDVDVADLGVLAAAWLDDTTMDAPESYTGVADYVPLDVFNNRIEAEWVDPNDPNACSDGPISDGTGIRINDGYPDASGGLCLTHAGAGAWVEYTIDVPALAVGVPVDIYAAHALNGSGTVTLSLGDADVPDAFEFTLDGTGNWGNFTGGRKAGVVMFPAAGPNVYRVTFGGGCNLDWFSFDW